MNGAEALVSTLSSAGIDVCFANPGTSEMQLVAAIGASDKMRPVLGLFEGVVTGAADGYGRMAGKPAATLLHLGPGLANGLSNIHNARRARTPMVNIIGDHAWYHRGLDAPLSSDIEGVARPFHKWIRVVDRPDSVGADTVSALRSACSGVRGPVALVVPADIAWTQGAVAAQCELPKDRAKPSAERVGAIARSLIGAGSAAMLLLSGAGMSARGQRAAGRIRAKTGCRLVADTFVARAARGAGNVMVPRLPYFAEQAVEYLRSVEHLVLIETKAPVAFFAYPDKPSTFAAPGTAIHTLASPDEDGCAALEALADALGAPAEPADIAPAKLPDAPKRGALDGTALAAAIARNLPEGAVVIDEGVTGGFFVNALLPTAAPHEVLDLTGGSIGYGLPAATGAAVAVPDRKVVCLEGDGSAMYTIQALWTQAREQLDVVTVILANRSYAILNFEMMRVGAQNPGPKALSMLSIGDPTLGFAEIARGMGVEAARATTSEEFTDLFAAAMRRKGPFLIEAVL